MGASSGRCRDSARGWALPPPLRQPRAASSSLFARTSGAGPLPPPLPGGSLPGGKRRSLAAVSALLLAGLWIRMPAHLERRTRSLDERRSRSKRRCRDGGKDDLNSGGREREIATAARAVTLRRRSRSRPRSGSPRGRDDRDGSRAVLTARADPGRGARDDGERDRQGHDRRNRSPVHGGHHNGFRGRAARPLPRPGYDDDKRLQQMDDDPRYFKGAELGKAQRAALGETGLDGRNTASFDPKSTLVRPAMRVFYGAPGAKHHEGRLLTDDVLVVPDFYCNEGDFEAYAEMAKELRALKGSGAEGEADLSDLPACKKAVKKICRYLSIAEEARVVRLALHGPAHEEEPFVHNFGKFKGRPSKGQNCIASMTFGAERETAYRRSGSQELLFFPQTNGSLSVVGKEVWLRWASGMNTYPGKDEAGRGHISITVIGESPALEEDSVLGPVQSDRKLGEDALSGRLGMPVADRARPEMRIITVPKRKRYGRPVRHDDVIIVPEFFCAEDDWSTYYQLIKEMRESQAAGNRRAEWVSWHEGAHLLSQNPTGSRTYQRVLDRMCEYFAIAEGNRGTRFNWYRDGSDWKPFHHDSAAFNPQRAASQNTTIGISFGAPRELAFRHAKTGELIYFPQKNGMLFYFGRDANIVWQHGINALPDAEQDGKGRISIILWGLCTTTVDEAGSPPMLSDDDRGKGKGKGKGEGKGKGKGKGKGGDWGYDGRGKQPCRDFQKGRCTYGDRCRFAHDG